jgi:hypothetical protein
MLVTRHPLKGIWNTMASIALCLMTDLEAYVEATILCAKF